MEEYLICREEIDKIAKEKLELVKRERQLFNQLEQFGLKEYTYEKRMNIIIQAKEMKKDPWVINELEQIHLKWESGDVTHEEIMIFAEFDMNIMNYRQGAYKNSRLLKLRNFLIGGEKDE